MADPVLAVTSSSPPRPPSRSERLLRDTLRKADDHERSLTHRRSSSSRRKHTSADFAFDVPPPEMPPFSRILTAPPSASSSPQEALLRSRLEHALIRVSSHSYSDPSHARSRSLADEWSYDPMSLTPPPTPPPATPPPSSPSPSPSPFNARAASQICRQLPGYVSFQDVEGLGEPPSDDTDAQDDTSHDSAHNPLKDKDDRRWWIWPWIARARAQTR